MLKSTAESRAALQFLSGVRAERESLHELFHENTKYTQAHAAELSAHIAAQTNSHSAAQALSRNFKVYRFSQKIPLPTAECTDAPLCQALTTRISTREFTGEALSLGALSQVLVPAAACHRTVALREFPLLELRLRSYPSGGAAFPIELYAILLRVEGSPPSVTHFDPCAQELSVITSDCSLSDVEACLLRSEGIPHSAAVLLVLTAIFERSTGKYGARGYRLALLEAGHLAQNLCLTAAAAGLGTLTWGGYFDDALNHLLGVDGVNEAVVHCLFVGGKAS